MFDHFRPIKVLDFGVQKSESKNLGQNYHILWTWPQTRKVIQSVLATVRKSAKLIICQIRGVAVIHTDYWILMLGLKLGTLRL